MYEDRPGVMIGKTSSVEEEAAQAPHVQGFAWLESKNKDAQRLDNSRDIKADQTLQNAEPVDIKPAIAEETAPVASSVLKRTRADSTPVSRRRDNTHGKE